MKLKIVTIGAPQLSFAREGFDEYVKRLGRFHDVHIVHVKDNKDAKKKLTQEFSGFTIALDENGKEFSSHELATFLDIKALQGVSEITLLIGGPEGHSEEFLQSVDYKWSHGRGTLPHDLAMLITAEALYRASTINAGHPYHRD